MERFGRREGVWICTFHEAKHVAFVLREMLLRESMIRSYVQNIGSKKEELYKYLISEPFKQKVEGIVDVFRSMKSQLDKEKTAMKKIWAERERQIENVIENTAKMHGEIKFIVGNEIGEIKAFELTPSND